MDGLLEKHGLFKSYRVLELKPCTKKMASKCNQVLLPGLLLLIMTSLSTALNRAPRLGRMRKSATLASEYVLPPENEVHNYTQTLDHFNYKPESYDTFQQRYILNFKYWGGANTSSPIFIYTGEEDNVIYDVDSFIINLAARFNGLLLYIEHRYYGTSFPFGSREEAFKKSSNLGYLSSEQALADYAQITLEVKKILSAESSPVIAVGASYGGMLASWFRLKYPHVVIGALASSSPILYFDDISPQYGYDAVVTKDFRDVSESCYNTIKQSFPEIDRVAAESNGLATLSKIFNTCSPLNDSLQLKKSFVNSLSFSAQYGSPPDLYVNQICDAIDGAPPGTDILGRAAAGYTTTYENGTCNLVYSDDDFGLYNQSSWDYQKCTEMVFPMGYKENETMFQPHPFDMNNYTRDCVATFGTKPRPHWATTEFGGHNIKTVLANYGSNIIFSNGLRDPWSAGGVLENISDTIVAIHTDEGHHCLDINTPTPQDPEWLVAQRDKEIKIIASWLAEYYAKLPPTI